MKVNRLAKIASVFAEEGLGYLTGTDVLKSVSGDSPHSGTEPVRPISQDRENAKRLKRVFERLGPTFVKFGQMLANRVDLFSDDFISELSSLHASVPPFENDIAIRIVESELARPIMDVFSEFSEKPVASASIAQVYRARLKDSGQEVAVKVQRPDLDKSLVEDLDLIIQMSSWLDALIPSYRKSMMHVVAKEYATASRMELDFVSEASAIEDFGEIYAEDKYFVFTKIYPNLCTAKLIVMEWFEGPRLGQVRDKSGLVSLGFDSKELVENLMRIQLSMAYEHGLMHGDMHPGNLILRKDGRLGIIDCGLYARIPKRVRETVLKMLLFQSQERVAEQVDMALQISAPADPRDLPKFRQELIAYFSMPQARSGSSVSKSIVATMRMGTKYKSTANPYLLMIVRNLVILEGIFLRLEPDFDPADHIGINVKAILLRRFAPDAVMKNFSPVVGEIAIALHNRPQLLSRLLRLEQKFIDSPTLGEFLRSEQVIGPQTNSHAKWAYLLGGLITGIAIFAVLHRLL
jgi:ubiquinone biosynthesis protein